MRGRKLPLHQRACRTPFGHPLGIQIFQATKAKMQWCSLFEETTARPSRHGHHVIRRVITIILARMPVWDLTGAESRSTQTTWDARERTAVGASGTWGLTGPTWRTNQEHGQVHDGEPREPHVTGMACRGRRTPSFR